MKSAYRLRWLAFGLTILTLTLSGVYLWRLSSDHRQVRLDAVDAAGRRARQLAELQAHHMKALFLGIDSSLRQFRDALESDNLEGARLIARNVLGIYPPGSVVHLARIDVQGNMRYATVELPKPVYVGDRDYFRFYQTDDGKDELFINRPVMSRSAHQWVVLFTRPLKKDDRFDGAAFISLSPRYFADMLADLAMAPGDISAILHEDGTYIARSRDLDSILGKSVPPDRPPLRKDAPRQGIYRANSIHDNQPRIFSWFKLADYPLIVMVGLDEKAILAPIEKTIHLSKTRNLIGVSLVFALTVALAMLLLRTARQQENLEKSEGLYREQSRRLAEVIWGTDAGTWEWYPQEDKIIVNERWAEMLGYSRQRLLRAGHGVLSQSQLKRLLDPDGMNHISEQLERCYRRETDILDCEVRMQHKNGHWIWVLARGRVVEWGGDGRPLRMSGTFQDITRRKLSEEKLKYIAYYDLLTELPNRLLLGVYMKKAMAQCNRDGSWLAVAYIDLDGFKEVNDSYGHDVGDQFLIAVANRMRDKMREVDTLARIGGDEFAALLVGLTKPSDCEPCLKRILRAVSDPFSLSEKVVQISASIGVTFFPQEGADAEQLLLQADQAMYAAKQGGKNHYRLFTKDRAESTMEEIERTREFRRPLEN